MSRNVNRVYTACKYLGVAVSLMFITNRQPVGMAPIEIFAKDIVENVTYRFPSIEQMQLKLGMPKGGYMKKVYLNTGKSYKGKWLFYSPDKYTDDTPKVMP